ncbi:MAG: rhodanese-like domain-containing protein [Actinomycetota bacterium]|nr:rhodanese-like domain-containing protein [Actinomycetota bacterium]
MILEQLYLGCLSQASYLIADEASGRAVVVDPRRDIVAYLDMAAQKGLRIELIVLTHVHADFIPGHTELAEATGAAIAMGDVSPVSFPIRRLADGERLALGDPSTGVTIEVLSTPGHTPESITLAVYQHGGDEAPVALLTGDTLFLGDVGRPDLLGSAGRTAQDMARDLYRSLHTRILTFPDSVLIYPGHGAGSACGKALSSETVATLGDQRGRNYALAPMSEEEFVAAITDGLAEPPAYFQDDVALNRQGHASFDPHRTIAAVAGADAVRLAVGGALVLDGRDAEAFAAGHLRGAVNVGLSGRFAEYAAAVHAPGQQVILFGSLAQATEALVRLARVGIESVVGAVTDPQVLVDAPGLVATSTRVDARAAAGNIQTVDGLQVVDVRAPGEFAGGTLPGAVNLPLPRLRTMLSSLDPRHPVLVTCAGGYRSIAAASMLEAMGFSDVRDLLGGWEAWQNEYGAMAAG